MTRARLDGAVASVLLALVVAGLVAVADLFRVAPEVLLGGVVATAGAVAVVAFVLVRHGVDGLGIGLLGVAVLSSTWNAVALGPIKITHLALLMACAVLGGTALVRRRPLRAPLWIVVLASAVVVVAVLSLLRPPELGTYEARYLGDALVPPVPGTGLGVTDLTVGLTWLVALLAAPIGICLVAPGRPRLVSGLVDVWVIGAVVNAMVILTDEAGLTTISARLLPVVDVGGRQSGLTVQPNHAAVAVALALPLAVWRLAGARRAITVLLAGLATVLLGAGLVFTESRAGVVASALAVLAMIVLHARARRLVPALALAGTVGAVLVLIAVPSALAAVAGRLRLDGSNGADTSDALRAGLARQGYLDVESSPLHGIGLQVADQAHNIYLQLLAAGGVILFLGFVAAWAGFFGEARVRDRDGATVARPIAVSGAAFLVVGAAANILTDVYVWLPFALMAGLWAQADASPAGLSTHLESARPTLEREELCS